MKKILSISLLLGVLFLYGCSASNKLSADQLFEKKQECMNYENQMKNDLSKRYISGMVDTDIHIIDIFYSPVKNSCIYVVKNTLYELTTHQSFYEIIDFLTKENIESCGAISETNCYEAKIVKKIKELKGE